MSQYDSFLNVSIDAAKKAGQIILDHFGQVEAKEKQPRDLVTQADVDSQRLIEQTLAEAFPDHGFVGEEEGKSTLPDSEFSWIVDPLDGTTNFVHQLPGFAVSIGLKHHDDIVLGTIFDPIGNECFAAAKGSGATLNGKPIKTSECTDIDKSLLVCSFPSQVERDSIEVNRFLNVLTRSTVRRMGSAALNLSYVACGRLDGYWASSLNLWDLAGGYAIAKEAGAVFSHIDGGPIQWDDPKFVMAGTQQLHDQLMGLMNS